MWSGKAEVRKASRGSNAETEITFHFPVLAFEPWVLGKLSKYSPRKSHLYAQPGRKLMQEI